MSAWRGLSFFLAEWGSILFRFKKNNCCAAGWWQAKEKCALFQHVISCYWDLNIIAPPLPPPPSFLCSNLEIDQYPALFIKVTAPGYCILHFYVFFLYKCVLKHNISGVLALWADKGWGVAVNSVKQLRNDGRSRLHTRCSKYPSHTSASVFA